MTPQSETPTLSPVLSLAQAAKYLDRSKNALRILRHRHRGPASFLSEGRIYYFRSSCDAWLAGQAAADPRYNPGGDPAGVAPQPRVPRQQRRPRTAA
ncbi:helix-turn-helix domain-containing protein [Streptomyces sp. NPDC059783]|uniref:helix-turn-helix domain-containing protein n=1 Tax=Streptomyces sp. NPDC059783 TaxID=3346944 RepID=UPI003651542E